ncbi:hypothetical protein CHS0354_002294 [Potamilus streckersoni]|uniref:Uncharacterized protein n=1 Tax=Potamilus streckersoni TaxID=2493646 RepID=A0AAE0SN64_9BIVA|nr:hypothetical protein CHS0354_002294 [Potamilus streckersoni]
MIIDAEMMPAGVEMAERALTFRKMASLECLKINAWKNGRTYYKLDSYWYSPDTAEHGGAAFKRYKDTKNTMDFTGSTNENREPLPNKHESREDTVSKKKDTKITKGDD